MAPKTLRQKWTKATTPKKGKQTGSVFDKYDCFSQRVSNFNIEGEEMVGTSIGFCLSIVVLVSVILYAGIKGKIMIYKQRPAVATVMEKEVRLEEGTRMTLEEIRFDIAFAVTTKNDFENIEPLHDPDKINWWASYKWYDEKGEKFRYDLKTHTCNQEDYSRFHIPKKQAVNQIKWAMENEIFMCLDQIQTHTNGTSYELKDLEMYGANRVNEAKLDLIYQPCIPRTETEQNKGEPCLLQNADEKVLINNKWEDNPQLKQKEKESKEYITDSPVFRVLYNQEQFKVKKYDDESVVKFSELGYVQFNPGNGPLYSENPIQHNYIDDETDYWQFGQSQDRDYTQFKLSQQTLPSSYGNYPKKYKYFGIEINLSTDVETTDRQTYGVLDYFGDLGGLVEILRIVVGMLVAPLSSMRLNAIMINRLYHVSDDATTKELIERMKLKAGDDSDKLHKRKNGDVEIDVPRFLDWSQLAYFLFCCCREKVTAFAEYKEALQLGNDGFIQDLDVVRFVRRQRMHGFGLHFLMGSAERSNSARLAFSRPLREQTGKEKKMLKTNDITLIKDKWYSIENLQQNDRFLISFFKRYGKIIYEELDKPKPVKPPPYEWQAGKSHLTPIQKRKISRTLHSKKNSINSAVEENLTRKLELELKLQDIDLQEKKSGNILQRKVNQKLALDIRDQLKLLPMEPISPSLPTPKPQGFNI